MGRGALSQFKSATFRLPNDTELPWRPSGSAPRPQQFLYTLFMDHSHAAAIFPLADALTVFFLLVGAHFLGDFGLQGDWMVKFKNRHVKRTLPSDVAATLPTFWPWVLTGHAFIHGLLVMAATQSVLLAIVEVMTHWVIDFGKCEGWYGFQTDQLLHIGVKLGYMAVILLGPGFVGGA